MPHEPNPELLDTDTSEATQEGFVKARPASDVMPGLFGQFAVQEILKPRCGRPALAAPKEHVNSYLNADIAGAFKETGAGWQTRLNSALRDWLRSHPNANGA